MVKSFEFVFEPAGRTGILAIAVSRQWLLSVGFAYFTLVLFATAVCYA
jgi:hypothetical protein